MRCTIADTGAFLRRVRHLASDDNPTSGDSVRACPRSRTGSAAAGQRCAGEHHELGRKALLVAGIALSLAIFGGAATLARHSTGHGQPHPNTSPVAAATTSGPPPPRQPMPTPQPAAALPRPSRRSTARSPTASCASRPPRATAAASAAGSSWPRTWWPPSLTLSREP